MHFLRRCEARPSGAIFMGNDCGLAVYSKDDFVWDKRHLPVPAAISPMPAVQSEARG